MSGPISDGVERRFAPGGVSMDLDADHKIRGARRLQRLERQSLCAGHWRLSGNHHSGSRRPHVRRGQRRPRVGGSRPGSARADSTRHPGIAQDSRGLRVEIAPDPEISYARDIMRSVARGDVTGMSFAFSVLDEVEQGRRPPDPRSHRHADRRSLDQRPAHPADRRHRRARSLQAFRPTSRRQVPARVVGFTGPAWRNDAPSWARCGARSAGVRRS